MIFQHDEFPVITVCLNSMHSRNKIRLYYPELGIETAQKQENDSYALWDFYGKATSPQLRDYDVSLKFYC